MPAFSKLSRRAVLALALSVAVVGSACAATPPVKPLPVETLQVVTAQRTLTFRVEIAADDGSREYGLMNRPKMADDHGMIFDFHEPQPVAFWMKNTLIPLDMLFVAADGRVLNIAKMARPLDETPIPSAGPIRAVIEINGGLADKLGVRPGDRVIDEVVFPRR